MVAREVARISLSIYPLIVALCYFALDGRLLAKSFQTFVDYG